MDLTDLYDSEVAAIGPIWQKLMHEFSKRANTRANLDELAKRAHDEFFKVGLVVEVNTIPCIVAKVDPATGAISYGAPEIVITGRVPGSRKSNTEEGWEMMDHEKKRAEVLLSRERGEKFAGEKFKNDL